MKVYVDKFPKSCKECPCCSEQDFAICSQYCEVLNEYISEIVESEQELKPKTCPLQSLADYTKQVRNDVAQEVLHIIDNNFNCLGYVEEKFDNIKKCVLEKMQGE